jgi:hypothetical protein
MPELELEVAQVAPAVPEVQSLVVEVCRRAIGTLIQDEATKQNPNPMPSIDDPRWEEVKEDSTKVLDLLKRAPDVLTIESQTSAMYFSYFIIYFSALAFKLELEFFNKYFSG